ncbi:MAG: metallophosphoesterase [Eubacteriales bacterium]|nr:metallophosphoesterase [Eubacteriales bacterium]
MGKKILVVSDSHGNMENLRVVLDFMNGKIDALVHCGDAEMPPDIIKGMVECPVYMAEGNCDYGFFDDRDDIFEMGGHICFVTHGDKYGVNWGEEDLLDKAMEMGADIVFYGHTHCPAYHIYEEEGVTILNPGSVALPRQNPPVPSFLVVDLKDNGEIAPHFYRL